MGVLQTVYVSLPRLSLSEREATLMIRLMMAFNDIAIANQSLGLFRKEQRPSRSHVTRGALMYFVRLQCGHLNEAMGLIREIEHNRALRAVVDRLSSDAQEAFRRLGDCLTGSERAKFHKYVGRVRDETAFHYDPHQTVHALRDRAGRPEGSISRITARATILVYGDLSLPTT